jgi:hypothetical protein
MKSVRFSIETSRASVSHAWVTRVPNRMLAPSSVRSARWMDRGLPPDGQNTGG